MLYNNEIENPEPKLVENFEGETKIRKVKDEKEIAWAKANLKNVPDGGNFEDYERMISGMVYASYNEKLQYARCITNDAQLDYADIRARDFATAGEYVAARNKILQSFMGKMDENTVIEYPFFFDYGFNTYIEEGFFANFNFTCLDCAIVRIGKNVLCGPNVTLTTATHPLDGDLRRGTLEYALPITIGENVWLCSNATVCPGVTIGDNAVVAAGAVVTKDVPANTVVAGVPARVIKTLDAPHGFKFDSRWFNYVESK